MALTTGLISFWELEEASGTRNDSHGVNHLTDNNTVLSGTGKVGTAADLERSNSEFLSLADNSDVSFGNEDFSWSVWINAESTGGGGFYFIISKDGVESREYLLSTEDDNQLTWYVFDGLGAHGMAKWGSTVSAATWYHVVAWHDATNNQVGLAVNNGTAVTASYSSGGNDGGSALCIGARRTDGSNGFDGLIDQVGLWGRVLTSTERGELYNGGAGLSYAAMSGGGGGNRRRRFFLGAA